MNLQPRSELTTTCNSGITYQDLLNHIERNRKNVKRDRAAVRDWAAWLQVPLDAVVGDDLGERFAALHPLYLDGCRESLDDGAFNNRRSALKSVRTLFLKLEASSAMAGEDRLPWKVAVHAAAQAAAISPAERRRSPYARWLYADVAWPSEDSREIIVRLEERARLPPGSLTRYIRSRHDLYGHVTPVADFSQHVDKYKIWLREKVKAQYFLKPQDNAKLFAGWLDYCEYQKCDDPAPLRRSKAWTINKRGEYATEIACHSKVASFFGWLCLPVDGPKSLRGLGLPPHLITISLLASWDLVRRYMSFRKERGLIKTPDHYGGDCQSMIGFFKKMTNPVTGWLAQTEDAWREDLRAALQHLGLPFEPAPEGYCSAQRQKCDEWLKVKKPKFVPHRKVDVTLAPFLDTERYAAADEDTSIDLDRLTLEEIARLSEVCEDQAPGPLEKWIFPLIRNLAADRPGRDATWEQRFWIERDLMMIVAFFSVPLRLINWQLCEIGVNLITRKGLYGLTITREEFKNREYLPEGDYDIRM